MAVLETSEDSELVASWARAKAARPKVATVVKKRILRAFLGTLIIQVVKTSDKRRASEPLVKECRLESRRNLGKEKEERTARVGLKRLQIVDA